MPARGTEKLSEIHVRRSNLELEPEEKRSARITGGGGGGSLSYYGKLGNIAYFVWKNRSRWLEPEQSSGTGLGRRAASLPEEAVTDLPQEQWLRPRASSWGCCEGRVQSRWRKMEGMKRQDPPAGSGGRGLEGEREKFMDPFPLCPNFSSPGTFPNFCPVPTSFCSLPSTTSAGQH